MKAPSVPPGDGGLTRYLQEMRKFPMLEREEERALAKSWRERADTGAAHRLVNSHLRLAAKIAMSHRGYGLPIEEIVSEGNVGLMEAVKRFEPDKGFRLATYAMWWIRASIQEYILRSWSLVKVTSSDKQRRLFFSLRKARIEISALEEGDLRPEHVKTIAHKLKVPEQDVLDMNRRLMGDVSLNAPFTRKDGEEDAHTEWQDMLRDESPGQEHLLAEREESDNRLNALHAALGILNERERRILEARILSDEPMTFRKLGAELKTTHQRVSQIEKRAFEKVQAAVKAGVAKIEKIKQEELASV